MIAGPGVCICNECIELCQAVLDGEPVAERKPVREEVEITIPRPAEIKKFFDRVGLTEKQITPVHADAQDLPFDKQFFDAVVSIDSYHYFGHDPEYLDAKILPFVKPGGYLYIAIPGMKKDCHGHLPDELLLSWTPEDLETMHDADYWRALMSQAKGAEVLSVHEMESNEECWNEDVYKRQVFML